MFIKRTRFEKSAVHLQSKHFYSKNIAYQSLPKKIKSHLTNDIKIAHVKIS